MPLLSLNFDVLRVSSRIVSSRVRSPCFFFPFIEPLKKQFDLFTNRIKDRYVGNCHLAYISRVNAIKMKGERAGKSKKKQPNNRSNNA